MRRRRGALATLLAASALFAGFAGGGARAGEPTCCELREIAEFNTPIHVANPPGQPNDLYVVEQAGRIRVLRGEQKLPRPFLDIRDIVRTGGEQGMFSIAFDPQYETNRRFYVYYSDKNGDIRVDEFRRSREKLRRANEGSRRKVIGIPHPGHTNHNGGQLQMTADRNLWMAPGDGGGQGDPGDNSQDPQSVLGKLLRIDPTPADGGPGHDIPSDNPFATSVTTRPEIWSLGLRNPFRFSFDAANGNLAIGDVGSSCWEEIDYQTVAAAKGANFGWDRFEGDHPFEGDGDCDDESSPTPPPNYLDPVAEYPHAGSPLPPNTGCSITGGYVVRDPSLPELDGQYLYTDFCRAELELRNPATGAEDVSLGDLRVIGGNPSSFGEHRVTKQIYVVSLNGPVSALEPVG